MKTKKLKHPSAQKVGNVLLLMLAIIFTVSVTEAVLRILGVPQQPLAPAKIYDDILLYRLPSDFPSIDANGFRNPVIPEVVDIVAIGDSHTYGYNVNSDETWPYQLGALTGKSVYNFGTGGYGPLQYYYLSLSALQLRPKYLIIGLYTPNDLKDVCLLFSRSHFWKDYSLEKNLDLNYCGDVRDPIHLGDSSDKPEKRGPTSSKPLFLRMSNFLKSTQVGALIKQASNRLADVDAENLVSIEFGEHITQINKNKLRAHRDNTNLETVEISRSLDVTMDILDRIDKRSREQGTHFVVLFIPSKEMVFYDYLRSSRHEIPSVYQEVTGNEKKIKSIIQQAFDAKGIKYVDGLESVRHAVFEEGGAVYPTNKDGHPLRRGYKAYAEAVYKDYWVKQASSP